MNRFTHFELATDDLEKTAAFYRNVFGWQIQKWEGPVDYWLVTSGDASTPGINGGLMLAEGGIAARSTPSRWTTWTPSWRRRWRTGRRWPYRSRPSPA